MSECTDTLPTAYDTLCDRSDPRGRRWDGPEATILRVFGPRARVAGTPTQPLTFPYRDGWVQVGWYARDQNSQLYSVAVPTCVAAR